MPWGYIENNVKTDFALNLAYKPLIILSMVPAKSEITIVIIAVLLVLIARKVEIRKYWPTVFGKLIIVGIPAIWLFASIWVEMKKYESKEDTINRVNTNTDSVGRDTKNQVNDHTDSAINAIAKDPHKALLEVCGGQFFPVAQYTMKDSFRLKMSICNRGGGRAFHLSNKTALVAIWSDTVMTEIYKQPNAFPKNQQILPGSSITYYHPFKIINRIVEQNKNDQYFFCFKLYFEDDLGKDQFDVYIKLKFNMADSAVGFANQPMADAIFEDLRRKGW